MRAGVRKMPLPIVEPTSTATALHRPSRRIRRSPQRSPGITGADIRLANYTLTPPCLGPYSREELNLVHLEVPPMPHFRSVPRLIALSVLALGCKTGKSFDRTTEPGGRPLSTTTTGSLIISGRALSADPGRTVLDAIRHSMPQLRIAGWTQYTRCPMLEMRGKDRSEERRVGKECRS